MTTLFREPVVVDLPPPLIKLRGRHALPVIDYRKASSVRLVGPRDGNVRRVSIPSIRNQLHNRYRCVGDDRACMQVKETFVKQNA